MEGTLFVNGLLSYLLVYFVFIAVIVLAFVIGFSARKRKNAQMISAEENCADEADADAKA